MKKFLLFCLLLLSPSAFAGYSAHVVASSTNITATYSGTYPQLALTALPNSVKSIMVVNSTGTTISLTSRGPGSAIPASPSGQDIYVVSNSYVILDNVGVASNLYLRSDGSTISTGDVYIFTF